MSEKKNAERRANQCDRKDCCKTALWTLHLRFWGKGASRETTQPAISAPMVKLCDEHKQAAKGENWYGPEQRMALVQGLRRINRAEPDFKTADVIFRAMDKSANDLAAIIRAQAKLAEALAAWDALSPDKWRALGITFPDVLSRRITALNQIATYSRQMTDVSIAANAESAANWNALRNCARMTTLGSAGIHPQSGAFGNPEGHLTLNLWTHAVEGWGLNTVGDPSDASARRDLDTFVRKVRALPAPSSTGEADVEA